MNRREEKERIVAAFDSLIEQFSGHRVGSASSELNAIRALALREIVNQMLRSAKAKAEEYCDMYIKAEGQ